MKLERSNLDTNKYNYSDLDLAFDIHPTKKDLILNKDEVAIKKAIKNLLLTSHYERPFHPELGSNIKRVLFEMNDSINTGYIEREIEDVITNFEPRVNINKIKVYTNNSYVMVDISYYLINSNEPIIMQIPLGENKF